MIGQSVRPLFNKLTLLWLASSFSLLLNAQGQAAFEAFADARKVVEKGYFEISFVLTNAEGTDFRPPNFAGFTVVSGPNRRVSTTIINGRVNSEESYSYTLQPRSKGTLTIASATIKANGRTLRSRPVSIEVVEGRAAGLKGDEEAFIRAEPSTEKAYIGQQVVLDYKLYTVVNIESFNILEESDYQGFFAQDIRRYDSRTKREVVNGVQYVTKILKRVVLFPQQAGKLEIEPMNVQLGVARENSGRRSFFFSPEIQRLPALTQTLTIEVDPLPPGAPPSFTGAVGSFEAAYLLDQATATTDDALSLRLTIIGNGDIKRVQAPALEAPEPFELYEPAVLEESNLELNGDIRGKKVFEYLMLPKAPGEYQLAPSFSYFDPDSSKYVTLTPSTYSLSIRQGSRNGGRVPLPTVGEQDGEQHIAFLKTDTHLLAVEAPFLGSAAFWMLLTAPFIALGGIVVFKIWRARRADIDPVLLRSRRARRMAERRLEQARQYLEAPDSSRAFYDEVSKAMIGYACDKLQVRRSALTKDKLRQKLEGLELDQQLVQRYIQVISTSEMALFAGKGQAEAMQTTYQEALQVIAEVERALSR